MTAKGVEETPEDQKKMVFGFMQEIVRDGTKFTILSETITGDQASVGAEFCIDGDMTGIEVSMAMEVGKWKVNKVHFDNKNYMVPDASDSQMMVPMKCE